MQLLEKASKRVASLIEYFYDVKDSKAQILTNKDGIIIDLDASSLYPSIN
jgi:hypothetical protein